MTERVDYTEVPAIVDALLSEGLPASVDRVRARLGRGSNQTIGTLVKIRLRELGKLPEEDGEEIETRRPLSLAADNAPVPCNPVMIAEALKTLRIETDTLRATAQAEAFMTPLSTESAPVTPDLSVWAEQCTSILSGSKPAQKEAPDGYGWDPAA